MHSVNTRAVFGDHLGWVRHGRPVRDFPLEAFKNRKEFPELHALRQDLKNKVWYAIMYGMKPFGLATSLKDERGNPVGEEPATKIFDALLAVVPGVRRYQSWVLDYILEHGGIVGLSGAWVDLSELVGSGDRWQVARAHRIAQNYPMQEGGARVIGYSMTEIDADPDLAVAGLKIERQIHDELDFRVPVTSDLGLVKSRIEKHMTSYPLLSQLQVKIGTGANWDEAK